MTNFRSQGDPSLHTALEFYQGCAGTMARGKTNQSPGFCIADSGQPAPVRPGIERSLCEAATARGWSNSLVNACEGDDIDEQAALVLLRDGGVDSVRRRFPHALLVAIEDIPGVDLQIPTDASAAHLHSFIGHSEEQWRRNQKVMALFREVGAHRQRMGQLSDIALSLSTKMEYGELLETILREARRLVLRVARLPKIEGRTPIHWGGRTNTVFGLCNELAEALKFHYLKIEFAG